MRETWVVRDRVRLILFVAAVAALSLLLAVTRPDAAASSPPPPDIVVIMTDDQAFHQLSFMPYTRQLLVDQGVMFMNAFVSTSLCCPTRATFLTGQYSHDHGVLTNSGPVGGATKFDDSDTVQLRLQAGGYHTAFLGKYMNDYNLLGAYVPPGWDDWYVHSDLPEDKLYYDYNMVENGTMVYYGTTPADYFTTVIRTRAENIIASTPAGTPLFLFFAPIAPHEPARPAYTDEGTFASLPPYRPPSYNEFDVSDKPAWVRNLPLMTPAEQEQTDEIYRRQIESLQAVDRSVLKIVSALDAAGRLDNTIIIFTTDNGYSLGAHRWVKKYCVYDDCSRIPFVVRAPGIESRRDGHLISSIDLVPTLLDYAGLAPMPGADGMSLRPLLEDPFLPWRDSILLEALGASLDTLTNYQGIRTYRFLYAEYFNGDRELYDTQYDPYMLTNVVDNPSYSGVADTMDAKLDTLRSDADIQVSAVLTPTAGPIGTPFTLTYSIENLGPENAVHIQLDVVSSDEAFHITFCTLTHDRVCVVSEPGGMTAYSRYLVPGESATAVFTGVISNTAVAGTVVDVTGSVVPFTALDGNPANDSVTTQFTVLP